MTSEPEELLSQPTSFVFIDGQLYYESPTRGLIRVVEIRVMPDASDVEAISCSNGNKVYSIVRRIVLKHGEDILKVKGIQNLKSYRKLLDQVKNSRKAKGVQVKWNFRKANS
ncbi:MAG: hypothetical protein QXS05_06280 [Candidatus Bathyarchaeia archaeon]